MKSRWTSPSSNVTVATSAVLSSSPCYVTAVGLAPSGARCYAIWFSGSTVADATPIWHLTASDQSVGQEFPAPLYCACMLLVAASGAGASALTAWDK